MKMSITHIDPQKVNAAIADTMSKLKQLNALKAQADGGVEQIEVEQSLLVSMQLSPDTLKARIIAYLHQVKRPRNAEEIRKGLKLKPSQRIYIWRITNAACFDGSPIRRVSLGRYQWKGH